MHKVNLKEEERIQRQKINYFNSKSGNKNEDIALSYLIESNWDEVRAVQNYKNKQKKPPSNNNAPNNTSTDFSVTDALLKLKPFSPKDSNIYTNFVTFLNGKFALIAKTLENFIKSLKDHGGMIIIVNKVDDVKTDVRKIKNNDLCSDIINNSVLFPIMRDSPLGKEFIKKYSCICFPSYIFCKYKNNKCFCMIGRIEKNFNINTLINNVLNAVPDTKANIRASLKCSINIKKSVNKVNDNNPNNNNNAINDNNDDNMWNYNDFCLGTSVELNKLIEQLGKADINNNNNNNDQNPSVKDSIAGLSDGQIMEKREREMRELERQQEEKMKKEEEEKQKIIDEENKKKKLLEDYEKDAEKCKKLLSQEPGEDDPNSCFIIFRCPDGEKNVERRFLKTEKVQILYYFIKSLGREIYFEHDSTGFDLVYGFPPKSLENSKTMTLEEEGLCPRCIIQIREK